ncbi:methyltransferase domain-containing protein [Streptomyces durbertensis]|uniref:Protein-L-isoaspartate O-methyltransferase n=2 Tax=Streptomyces durbertensis TaxID=2448886 RepID=A0ABR6ELN4_9ACTN|nr:methyltransferase domain-containing protein [Streptomyces durbertensis]
MTAEWAAAFAAVPRSAFLPDLMWPHDMATGRCEAVRRKDAPEEWQRYADSDCPIVTQWDDGAHEGGEPGRSFSSSSSMPSLVLAMLADLDARPGQRVLEIGTGTGWNAALLAHRLGADNVASVEVDDVVASEAREALKRCGFPVTVVSGDGALGHAELAPYDRVVVTCGVRRIPFAWVEQTKPGGVVLSPWGTYYGPGEATVRLVVDEDGRSATGPFTRPVAFMRMRSQRLVRPPHGEYVTAAASEVAERSTTTVTEAELLGGGGFDAAVGFALGLRLRDVVHTPDQRRDGRRAVWFYGLTDRSWAVVDFRESRSEARVHQAGPRRLWDEVESAYRWWVAHGRPDHTRFGLTVLPTGTHAWLDDPAKAWQV